MALTTLLRAFDVILGVSDLARRVKGATRAPGEMSPSNAALGHVETRLAAAAIGAIKEAFDRDSARLQLERAREADEDRRATAAARLEVLRQTGDRQLAEYRMQAIVALAGWLASVVFAIAARGELSTVSKGFVGVGWLFLLATLAASFAATARVLTWLGELPNVDGPLRLPAGSAIRWLMLVGLALTASGILLGL